ncbi:hypothetical protein HJD18_00210 [Thermoleophilia bacterium SCSIO 60948]|nr:hypothetical protein HJD18_00210 [Thermoleophilia bacterium SCSIO 60948]
MERVLMLAVLTVLALAGALAHDPASEPSASLAPQRDALSEGFELANDPTITRCLTDDPPGAPELPEVRDLSELVRAVSGQMVGIRQLTFDRPVNAEFLSSRQIERRITELVAEETDPQRTELDNQALALLGAIEPGTDVGEVTEQALTSQVAGLYVPKTEELLVRADGFGTVELVTLAHELEHALADQALGIPLPDGEVPEGRSDSVLARQALVEGDATLAMSFYQLGAIGPEAQLSLLFDPAAAGAQDDLERIPDFFQRQLLYPYTAGLAYVCDIYTEEGWDGVDEAYRRPPSSTAEVMFGDRAAEQRPAKQPGDPGEGWRSRYADELGAAPLGWLLAAPGGDPEQAVANPEPALRGLEGSRLELWESDSGEFALGVSLRGEPEELCRVSTDFLDARVDGEPVEPDVAVTEAWEADDVSAALDCERGGVRFAVATALEPAVAMAAG